MFYGKKQPSSPYSDKTIKPMDDTMNESANLLKTVTTYNEERPNPSALFNIDTPFVGDAQTLTPTAPMLSRAEELAAAKRMEVARGRQPLGQNADNRAASHAAPQIEEKPFTPPKETGEKVLTIGARTVVKGEIAACDALLIAGQVDATISNVRHLEITPSGSVKGKATVEYAVIKGRFEGELTVTHHLIIHESGQIAGVVSYGTMEVKHGGAISGTIVNAELQERLQDKREDALV